MSHFPETVLQFGSGKFLRAFADFFIDQANKEGQDVGRVVVVQSTGASRASLLNTQRGRYHVWVRGLSDGDLVDRVERVESVSRALVAAEQWDEVLAVARSPQLRYVISNTAEAGYTLDPADRPNDRPPRSFPAKLLLALKERFEAGQPGVVVLPCELFERNAELLLKLLLQLARAWQLPEHVVRWIQTECIWPNTLVDRIVCVQPVDDPELQRDGLLALAEPYALWAIDLNKGSAGLFRHAAIQRAPDIQPFFLRKVRILNAAHTALLSQALPRAFTRVREAVLDPEIAAWLDRLLFEEIIPTLEGRVEDPEGFARQTLERFCNPFLEHKLVDIAKYHEAKVRIRLVSTRDEFVRKFGRTPALLEEAIQTDIKQLVAPAKPQAAGRR
jgi:tagaturonate reductase